MGHLGIKDDYRPPDSKKENEGYARVNVLISDQIASMRIFAANSNTSRGML